MSLQREAEIDRVYTWIDAPEHLQDLFVSDGGQTSIGFIELNIDEGFAQNVLADIQGRLSSSIQTDGFEATILGAPAFWAEMNELSQQGLENAHLYALPIILIVLLVVFRSVVSSLMPLVLSSFSIVTSLGVLYWFSQWIELSIFVLDAALMLGIGVGIDFALIFIKRFREQLEQSSNQVAEAVTQTMVQQGTPYCSLH